MIGVDWGTSSLRAYRIGDDGAVLERVAAPAGILSVRDGDFAGTLRAVVGPWLAAGERRVLLSGMIGSRQGWVEAPYLPCPARAMDIAGRTVAVAFAEAEVRVVPGLSAVEADGTPEVMRGEETQIVGAGLAEGLFCLPGSHSKWVTVAEGGISSFATYFSGEAFAALRSGTILGRMMTEDPDARVAFAEGVARSAAPGHLLHHLFGVRTRGLFGQLADADAASYLSGLLVGHEIRAALPAGARVHLIGSAGLCGVYAAAIAACGGVAVTLPEDLAATGLARIGEAMGWI